MLQVFFFSFGYEKLVCVQINSSSNWIFHDCDIIFISTCGRMIFQYSQIDVKMICFFVFVWSFCLFLFVVFICLVLEFLEFGSAISMLIEACSIWQIGRRKLLCTRDVSCFKRIADHFYSWCFFLFTISSLIGKEMLCWKWY